MGSWQAQRLQQQKESLKVGNKISMKAVFRRLQAVKGTGFKE